MFAALAAVAFTAALLPLGGRQLSATTSFLPAMLAIVGCFDVMSVYLLVGEFRDRGDRRLLMMSWAYVWSLVTMLAYALAFPGVVSVHPPLALTTSMAPWFYLSWHAGFPVLLGVAWARWPTRWTAPVPQRRRRRQAAVTVTLAAGVSVLAVTALSLRAHALPVLIVGVNTSRMTSLTAPVVLPITVLALISAYRGTRGRTGPERWAVIVVLVCLGDLLLTYASRHRYSLGWYAGRSLTLVASGLVLAATVAALRRAKARAETDALIDSLTGLANRRSANRDLQLLLNFSRRTNTPLSAISFDIDLFKDVNDQHGHDAGDRVLADIGAALPAWVRASDVVARVGGEEFLVLLPGTGVDGAQTAAEKIRLGVQALTWPELNRPVTISLGVGSLDDPAEDANALLRRIDAALYAAKALGRNRTVLAPSFVSAQPWVAAAGSVQRAL